MKTAAIAALTVAALIKTPALAADIPSKAD